MENYWFKDIAKSDWINEMSKSQNLSKTEVAQLETLIVNDPVRFYIVFEKGEMRCLVAFDGVNSILPTQLNLSSSLYDAKTNSNTHILVATSPKTKEFLGKFTFIEDFTSKKLYSGKTEVVGFNFLSTPIQLVVTPALGSGEEIPVGMPYFCCSACYTVHAALSISGLNCICCFYIGGCGGNCLKTT
jgi:hypothetical protein